MSALRRLERGGYAFELTPGGNIAFHYAGSDEPPAAWADPLLALLREERDTAEAILRAREEWLAVYDESVEESAFSNADGACRAGWQPAAGRRDTIPSYSQPRAAHL